jgi:hypothetical protein
MEIAFAVVILVVVSGITLWSDYENHLERAEFKQFERAGWLNMVRYKAERVHWYRCHWTHFDEMAHQVAVYYYEVHGITVVWPNMVYDQLELGWYDEH